MKLLIFGAGGIVGRAMTVEAALRGWHCTPLAHAEVDITHPEAVAAAIAVAAPQLIVNCAAFTQVDRCESERELARANNETGAGIVAEASRRHGARLIHLSTDYVFDGEAREPYTESSPTSPISAYGVSKLGGEGRVLAAGGALIVRTSGVFGAGGRNFVDSIAGRARRGEGPLRVVRDQVGAPTFAPFLARALADLGESGLTGIVHYRNREPASWYEFARAIVRLLGDPVETLPVTSAEMPTAAKRPAWSVLAVEKFESIVGRRVEPWNDGLLAHLDVARKERA
jgi:dTDP-4-dehydrorhamnose reductase/4-ketoreductase